MITTAWLVGSYFTLRRRDWMAKFYEKIGKWKEHRNRETASNVFLFIWEGKARSWTKLWSKEGNKEQKVWMLRPGLLLHISYIFKLLY